MAGRKPIPKTQRELSIEQQVPYNGENPNSFSGDNRAKQTSFRGDTTKPISIGLQDIDESVVYYFNNVIKPFVYQDGERVPVPIEYSGPEKWKTMQKEGYYRDARGAIMAPFIVFKRNNIEKIRTIGNKMDANNPNNYNIFTKNYTTRNAYDNFSVLNNQKPEKTYYAVAVPDYVKLTYTCVIYTYYMEQMNRIIEAIEYASDTYWGNPEMFKFRARIDSFNTVVELSDNSDRAVKGTFDLVMNGYIIPDNIQKDVTALKKYSDRSRINFTAEVDFKK